MVEAPAAPANPGAPGTPAAPGQQATPPAAPAEERIKEKDRVITELQERAKRAEEMVNAFLAGGAPSSSAAPAPAAPAEPEDVLGLGEVDFVRDGKKALETVYKKAKEDAKREALDEARRMYQGEQQATATKRAFYEEHKDLSGNEPIVHHFATVLDREMPYATIPMKFAEIAKRSRAYLQQIRTPQPPEPSVPAEPGSGMTPPAHPAAPGGGARLPSDEEEFRAAFAEKADMISKKKQPLGSAL